MMPDFVDIGSLWKVLPPGIHNATIEEVEARFAITDHRKHLFSGFKNGVMELCKAGCRKIYLDGSFITEKPIPNDFDACWDNTGVDDKKLDPVFNDFSNGRKNQKNRFYGEFFPANLLADGRHIFLDYFQEDKDNKKAKGIICINLPTK
jgi:hypothetical protein